MVVITEWAGANTSDMETDTNIFQHTEQNMSFLSMPLQMDFSSKGKTEKDEGLRVGNDRMESAFCRSLLLTGKK
jgi:hypothetical protein